MKPLISRGRWAAALALLAVWILTPSAGHSQVPKTISYQGSLTDASGNPVTGSLSITFRLYNTATGGTALWIEPRTVAVTNGAFNVVLGNVTPLDESLFANQLFLGIQVGADTEMIPRRALTSVPYAFRTVAGDLLTTIIDNLAELQVRGASAYVFVTSERYTGNLGGVAGADDKCQALADQAGLPGVYLAWIADSSPNSAPAARFTQAPFAYILPPGPGPGTRNGKVDDNWTDLTSGFIERPIDVDEGGNEIGGEVWTNVRENGVQFEAILGDNCFNWTFGTSGLTGTVGTTGSFTPSWSLVSAPRRRFCDSRKRLYCFGN